jgi:hypothetical protein
MRQVTAALAMTASLEREVVMHLKIAQAEKDDGGPLFETDFDQRIRARAAGHDRVHAAGLSDTSAMDICVV